MHNATSHLAENGRSNKVTKKLNAENNNFRDLFIIEELTLSFNTIKNGKAPTTDNIMTEQIKHFRKGIRR